MSGWRRLEGASSQPISTALQHLIDNKAHFIFNAGGPALRPVNTSSKRQQHQTYIVSFNRYTNCPCSQARLWPFSLSVSLIFANWGQCLRFLLVPVHFYLILPAADRRVEQRVEGACDCYLYTWSVLLIGVECLFTDPRTSAATGDRIAPLNGIG